MANLLRLDASARKSRSLSRGLADHFFQKWQLYRPDDKVVFRDLGSNPPPAISEQWIGAAFTSSDARTEEQKLALAMSDKLIAELESADLIVISTPMYNYGMPTALKAWFDQVIRVNQTFTFDLSRGDYPLEPVFRNKVLIVLTSCGEFGFAPGQVRADRDHLVPHIKTCAPYLGVNVKQDFYHVGIEYQEFNDSRHDQSKQEAYQAVASLVRDIKCKISSDEFFEFSECLKS